MEHMDDSAIFEFWDDVILSAVRIGLQFLYFCTELPENFGAMIEVGSLAIMNVTYLLSLF